MAKIIAVINQKGGVGKSTTAHALGAGLYLRGNRVLFIDLDAQCNLSYSLGADTSGPGALDAIDSGQLTLHNLVDSGQLTGDNDGAANKPLFSVLPGSPALSGADMLITQTGKEFRLREALTSVDGEFDYIIIDTPPALGILTINALTAAHYAVIPAQADIYSLQGIGQLYGTIDAVRKYTNPGLKILGILITRYNGRAILSRDIADMTVDVAQTLDTIVFNTRIRECIALKEAQAQKQDIFTYAPHSNAAADYASLLEEVLLSL